MKDFKITITTLLNDSFFSSAELLAETKSEALKMLAEQKEFARKSGVMFQESSIGRFVGMKYDGDNIWDFDVRIEINF